MFRGLIHVEQSAQQTNSKQLSRMMLLSNQVRLRITPSLKIVVDNVVCTNGATMSELSEEEMF